MEQHDFIFIFLGVVGLAADVFIRLHLAPGRKDHSLAAILNILGEPEPKSPSNKVEEVPAKVHRPPGALEHGAPDCCAPHPLQDGCVLHQVAEAPGKVPVRRAKSVTGVGISPIVRHRGPTVAPLLPKPSDVIKIKMTGLAATRRNRKGVSRDNERALGHR